MMEVIPAIDILDGRCVRLTQGDYAQKVVYTSSPLEVAQAFESFGARRLHLVDLDGARTGKISNLPILSQIALHTSLQIDFSGGIKSLQDVQHVLDSGATWVTLGSLAAKEVVLTRHILQKFGPEKVILSADVKEETLYIHGWVDPTSWHVYDFIHLYQKEGAQHFFCTDITRDGMLSGPSVALYQKILSAFPDLYLIASGGIASTEDLAQLKAMGCRGAIVGKALYEGKIPLTLWHTHTYE
ncbi:MAG: 1-(5-phosphoribosyl)-5-[(5-phosphoribosylamino)methylideneamino]imidazole-4-carboxamide isomerase [Bacteroidia bacterium]